MKTPLHNLTSRQGHALVIALAFIALISALVMMWFHTTSHALRSAKAFDHSVAAERLAEMAVNVVKAQIADGTRTMKEGAAPEDPAAALVWTSQPGLIRTYATGGLPYRFYKLYSSDTMVVTQFPEGHWSPEENAAREVPDDWHAQPALFTDLNAPTLLPLSSRPPSDAEASKRAVEVNGNWYLPRYPIVDPSAQQRSGAKPEGVEGFRIEATRVSGAPANLPPGYNPMVSPDGARSGNPVPMPARWLYVLRDGQTTVPERFVRNAAGDDEAQWTPGRPASPSRENPIVGRIAFWADDETCKLNVNTASEGVFWDRPCGGVRYDSEKYSGTGSGLSFEDRLATGIPRRDEWQRMPGHPATTCLSPVFGMLPDFRVPANPLPSHYPKYAAYYRLAPRIGIGGTEAGLIAPPKPAMTELDRDRLFASTDELAFTTRMRAMSREPRASGIDDTFLEKAKFFLTTSNRAPETNVFNRPRISMWPVQQERDPNHGKPGCPDRTRSLQDDRLAVASTVGGEPYHFQRFSAYLTGAINDPHSNPPFGQQGNYHPPSSQRSDLDWRLSRNQELYQYLQELTNRPIPGVAGKSVAEKFGADRDQLLTSMVDLLRNANTEPPIATAGSFAYTPPHDLTSPIRRGMGQIVPLIPPDGTPGAGTKGVGRFPSITEAAMVFYGVDKEAIGAMLVLEPFTPVDGPPTWSPLTRICVKGLDQFSVNNTSLDMPKVATNLYSPVALCNHGSQAFPCHVPMYTYWRGTRQYKTFGTASEQENYPFYSRANVVLPQAATQMRFSGGKITVEIHAGYHGTINSALVAPPAETLVQTLHLDFPPATFPVPARVASTVPGNLMGGMGTLGLGVVIRSVEADPAGPSGGDLRLIAGPRVVPASYFRPHPDYHTTLLPAHSLRTLAEHHLGANVFSELYPGDSHIMNVTANRLQGAYLKGTRLHGDWTSGTGFHPHGALISVPDQGTGGSLRGGYYEERFVPESGGTFSAHRQLPSPVVFGSLPVGIRPEATQPWRTLLFCANPAAGKHHPGWQQPRDHYLLDLFQMPVVEPYPLSDSLSSAGKVNLNYQLVPFIYIKRDTALRGAFRSTKVTTLRSTVPASTATARLSIDADETLKGFERRFAKDGDCFKSASELCEMFLVPQGAKLDDMKDGDPNAWWWKGFLATGDNLRESPYNHLYPRVTSRSNTFTIHYRVQVLSRAVGDPSRWVERPEAIAREARGAATLEQYIDPEDPRLPDFATKPNATLDAYYKFRAVRAERFVP